MSTKRKPIHTVKVPSNTNQEIDFEYISPTVNLARIHVSFKTARGRLYKKLNRFYRSQDWFIYQTKDVRMLVRVQSSTIENKQDRYFRDCPQAFFAMGVEI